MFVFCFIVNEVLSITANDKLFDVFWSLSLTFINAQQLFHLNED